MTFTTALVLYGALTLAMVGFGIFYTYATQGFGFGFSSNRGEVTYSKFAIRMKRTFQNHIEAGGYGVPILTAAAVLDLQGTGVHIAAMLFVIGRGAFVLLYYTGVPFIRVPAFLMATLSIFYITYHLAVSAWV